MRRKGLHWAWVILAVCFVDLFINYSIWRFCWYVLGAWALIMVLVNGIFLRFLYILRPCRGPVGETISEKR